METNSNRIGIKVIDLGLSSKWASCNLGANTPEESGVFFAWGEIEPKSVYGSDNYKWFAEGMTSKYGAEGDCANIDPDIQTILDPADDVAHVRLGESWRMPSMKDIAELHEKCAWRWTRRKGVKGCLLTSKVEGFSDRSLFLPAAGCIYQTDRVNLGYVGYYWSSSIYKSNSKHAILTAFDSKILIKYLPNHRYAGMPIRPVCD